MVSVLCYHRISDIADDYNFMNVTIDNFKKHMKWVSANYKIISTAEYEYYEKSDEKVVAITFDDGYRCVFENALPVLEKYHIPATLFIATENIDTDYDNWTDIIIRCIFQPSVFNRYFELHNEILDGKWDLSTLERRVSFYRKVNLFFRRSDAKARKCFENTLLEWAGLDKIGDLEKRIITSKQIKTIADSPLIGIGAHSVTHPSLGSISVEEQDYEIGKSIKSLEAITGKKVDSFAYPFGSINDYSAETIKLLKEYGITKAFTTQSVNRDKFGCKNLEIPRSVCLNMKLKDFKEFVDNSFDKTGTFSETNKDNDCEKEIYIGSVENDKQIFGNKNKLILWGCGFFGKKLYQDLVLCGVSDRVIAFGDNDKEKVGSKVFGLDIIDVEHTLAIQKKEPIIVLVRNAFDYEIANQLSSKGINKIHIINRH